MKDNTVMLTCHSERGTHTITTTWSYILNMLMEYPFSRLVVESGGVSIFQDMTWRDSWLEFQRGNSRPVKPERDLFLGKKDA